MLLLSCLPCILACITASPLPKLLGSFLRIEILKDGNSELRTTILGQGQIVPLSGTAPYGTSNGIEGELVPFSPLDACSPITESNYTKVFAGGKAVLQNKGPLFNSIALISYGGCPLSEKLVNAQKVFGIAGVLLYLDGTKDLSTVSGKVTDVDIDIPGFIISRQLGTDLLSKISKYRTPGEDTDFELPSPTDKGVKGSIKMARAADKSPWIKATIYHVSDRTSLKGVAMMVMFSVCILLLAAFLGSLLMHCQIWRRQRSEAERNNANMSNDFTDAVPNLPPINADFISKLPSIEYDKSDAARQNKDGGHDDKAKAPIEEQMPIHWGNKGCPICLDEFESGEKLMELPCGHYYHPSCITPWLLSRSPCCPLCKIDSRIGPVNALLIQMGKPPNLPKQKVPNFCKYFATSCLQMLNCCSSSTPTPTSASTSQS